MRLLKFAEFVNEMFLNEGGNAIEDARPIQQSEVDKTYDYVKKEIFSLFGLRPDLDATPIGSFKKKLDNQTSGDIDIACSIEAIAGNAGITMNEVLDHIEEVLQKAGFSTKKVKGFNQISVGVPIEGDPKKGTAQIDLMLTANMEWSKFMYHSPDFRQEESKYKGMYRNILLMSIVSECKKEATKKLETGETVEYKQYVIRLESGIWEVGKSFMGAKGLVKSAKLLHDQDKFVTSTPEAVTEIAFGSTVLPSQIMTFEEIWKQFEDPKFIHRDKHDAILKRFKDYILSCKVPVPTEVSETYPNLFN